MRQTLEHRYLADLSQHPKVVETRRHLHHSVSKFDHLVRSARYAKVLAPILRADTRTCVRAAILHDIDSRLGSWSNHGAIAASFAAEVGESDEVCAAIRSHMFPMGPAPTSRAGWVLAIADKLAAISDMADFVGGLFTGRSLVRRRRLRQEDPFYKGNRKSRHPVKAVDRFLPGLNPSILPVAQGQVALGEHRW